MKKEIITNVAELRQWVDKLSDAIAYFDYLIANEKDKDFVEYARDTARNVAFKCEILSFSIKGAIETMFQEYLIQCSCEDCEYEESGRA